MLSAWSGIRPLATPPREKGVEKGTENVSRDHVVADERDGVVTVTGGKWTTYRLMAEHAVDAAVRVAARRTRPSRRGPGRASGRRRRAARSHRAGLAQTILMENSRRPRGLERERFRETKKKDERRRGAREDDARRRGRRRTPGPRVRRPRASRRGPGAFRRRAREAAGAGAPDARRRGGVRGAGGVLSDDARLFGAQVAPRVPGRRRCRSRRARGERGARERTRMGLVLGGESCGNEGFRRVSVLTRIPDAEKQ